MRRHLQISDLVALTGDCVERAGIDAHQKHSGDRQHRYKSVSAFKKFNNSAAGERTEAVITF